jgi:hypothetical protein
MSTTITFEDRRRNGKPSMTKPWNMKTSHHDSRARISSGWAAVPVLKLW